MLVLLLSSLVEVLGHILILSSLVEVLELITPAVREIVVLFMVSACVLPLAAFVENRRVGPVWVYPANSPVYDKDLQCNVLWAVRSNGVSASISNSPAVDTLTHVTIRVEDLIWEAHLLTTRSLIHFDEVIMEYEETLVRNVHLY